MDKENEEFYSRVNKIDRMCDELIQKCRVYNSLIKENKELNQKVLEFETCNSFKEPLRPVQWVPESDFKKASIPGFKFEFEYLKARVQIIEENQELLNINQELLNMKIKQGTGKP